MDLSVLLQKESLIVFLVFLVSLSEVLALVPQVKANSIFQLVVNVVKKVKEFVSSK